jgi:ribosomal protein L14
MLDVWCVCVWSVQQWNANAVVKRGQIVNTVIVESVGQLQPPVLARLGGP